MFPENMNLREQREREMRTVYDVRAVRFIKATKGKTTLENRVAQYVCLGHFDQFAIDSLPENGNAVSQPLRAIQEDRVQDNEKRYENAENCVYSLYMLQKIEDSQGKERLRAFWERESVFMAITRIHCKSLDDFQTISSGLQNYCITGKKDEKLLTLCPEVSNNGPVVTLKAAVAGAGIPEKDCVECVFYDSLELGDTVSVMKSASLSAILEVVRYISTASNVRDTYTYCGILFDCLPPDSTGKCMVNPNARIQHLSTRFSIRNVRLAKKYFECLGNKLREQGGRIDGQFYVTGTADHLIQWDTCDEATMLNIVWGLLENDKELPGCFNDVITRVGLDYWAPDGDGHREDVKSSLRWAYLSKIQKKFTTQEWLYPLRKLLTALSAMERNYVMDGLAMLLIPGVNAFLQRLNALSKEEMENRAEEINYFLHVWAELSNDISQLESQLTQHPELAPVRYYIPALLLQFELRFLEKCAFSLSDPGKRSFRPLLAITDEFNMYTVCPLDPGDDEYNGECPLLVFIPVRDLYSVWEIALRATHEVAHYCEDSARCRNLRYDMLVRCMVHAVINTWFKDMVRPFVGKDMDERKLYSNGCSYEKELAERIRHFADEHISGERDSSSGEVHLDLCVRAIQSGLEKVMERDSFLEQYLLHVLPDFFYRYRRQYQMTLEMKSWRVHSLAQQQDLQSRLYALRHLCEECYADIAMILLLNLRFEDYYSSVYQGEYERLSKMGYAMEEVSEFDIICHIQRMSQVVLVMSSLKKETWDVASINENGSAWIGYALKLLAWLGSSQEEGWDASQGVLYSSARDWRPEMLDLTSFKLLNNYLMECANTLKEKLNQAETGAGERAKAIQEVRENVQWISDLTFNWEKIQLFLLKDVAKQSEQLATGFSG